MIRLRNFSDMVLGIWAETVFAAFVMAWAGIICLLFLFVYP
jgi:hypothetical protein